MYNPEAGPAQKTPEQLQKEYEERNAKIAEEREIDAEDITRNDAGAEKWAREGEGQRGWKPDLKEKLGNSDLTWEFLDDDSEIIKGNIDGKNIEIQVAFGHRTHSSYIARVIKSTIDGKPLDQNEAKDIFNKYKDVARSRTTRLNHLELDAAEKRREDEKKIERGERKDRF